jgi:hypothetical protein
MLAVAATYALMRRMFSPLVGLSSAGFQATVLWALFFNRLGLRLNQLPFLLCVTVYCFWRGIEVSFQVPGRRAQVAGSKSLRATGQRVDSSARSFADSLIHRFTDSRLAWFVAAGAWMGACLYTYSSSRVVPLILGAFTAYLLVHDLWIANPSPSADRGWRGLLARRWPILVCFAVAALVAAPIAPYLGARSSTTNIPQREEQVNRPLRELSRGNLQPVLGNAWGLLKMWNVDGERYWQLNYSHRPVFVEPISGLLFWIGALIALWRWKDPRMALLMIWIGLGMVPSLITSEAPSWPRTMLASPAALALPGIAVHTIRQRLRVDRTHPPGNRQARKFGDTALSATLTLSLLLTAALTYRDYLVVWPKHPRVRYAFQSSLTEALRYLDTAPDSTPTAVSGLSPHDVDPWTEKCTLRRRDLEIRWLDTRSALILPPGDVGRLVVLDITPIEPILGQWAGLTPEAVLAQGAIVPRGGTEYDVEAPVYYDPAYTVYRLDVTTLRQRIGDARQMAYVGSDPFDPTPLDAPPQFGDVVRLAGYEWLTSPVPGAPAQLLTFWEALNPGPRSTVYGEPALRTFVHLLDGARAIVARTDVLGVAPDTWLAGDVIVQLHAFTFPNEPGDYALEVGWYIPPDGPRLPVTDVNAPGQRILLDRVEIAR